MSHNRRPALMIILATCSVLLTSQAAAAHAEDTSQSPATVYDFDDDLVKGDTLGPNVEVLHARKNKARDSLVHAKDSFLIELLHSVEQI
jgi:hypothetical protein